MSADYQVGTLRHDIVGIDAVVFDDPFAAVVGGPEGEFGGGDEAAIAQGNATGDADEAAPRARAYDGPDFFAMEKPWESIAARAGEFVDEHHLRAVDGDRGPANVVAFAGREDGQELALEFFRVEVGDLAAGVAALVDDDAVFVELGAELFIEGDDARDGGVWHVHVADAAVGSFGDFAAIGFDPVQIVRTIFAGNGLYGDFPGAVSGRLGVELEGDELSREVLEIGVDIEIGTGFAAIDSDEIVTDLDLQARLGERRARGFGPVLSGIDLRDTVKVAVRLEVSAKQADADVGILGLVTISGSQ